MKAFLDGTLGSRTATMLAPYADGGSGVELLAPADFEQLVRRAAEGGLAVAVHAIGDRANRVALDAFEATRELWEPAGLRPRIEHAQILDPTDVPRFAKLGVVASMQPSHAPSDRDAAETPPSASAPRTPTPGARCSTPAPCWRSAPTRRSRSSTGSPGSAPPSPARSTSARRGAPSRRSRRSRRSTGFTAGAAWAAGHERRRGRLDARPRRGPRRAGRRPHAGRAGAHPRHRRRRHDGRRALGARRPPW